MRSKHTPLMTQYQAIKDEHKDGILFFQVGDFYETFYDDARKVSRLLNIALTSRDKKNPVPLAGVPIHASGTYISKLLQAGEKVVICDQVERPGEGKGIVRRQVTDIITPGTCLEPSTLDEKTNNFIAAVMGSDAKAGFSVIDLSTGEFHSMQGESQAAENLLAGYHVREALIPEGSTGLVDIIRSGSPSCAIEELPSHSFNIKEAVEGLMSHFGVNNLSCFGIEGMKMASATAGTLLRHVKELRQSDMAHISGIRSIVPADTLFLDSETIRNLELVEPMRGDSPESTLIRHIDRTRTAAGARVLRSWLMHPSRLRDVIEARLEGISSFSADQIKLREIRKVLSGFPDIERLLSRITTGKAGPREVLALGEAIGRAPELAGACVDPGPGIIREKLDDLATTVESGSLVQRSIAPDAPAKFKEGGVIRKGFDEDLDRLIDDSEGGRKWIAALQSRERERTGIPSLKVGYNKVFGYYIEVSRIHDDKIPDDYTCKQSLVASQRYVSIELKSREQEILTADSRRIELEKELFSSICSRISDESNSIQKIARAVAVLDALSALADLAVDRGYCRPEIDNGNDLVVTGGRHPVVEIISGKAFIPNDILIRPNERQFLVITGPNMGGKSTYIRQAALISIMAQMGSFVPASRARIGIMDRIFTRVGSSDNLARGQSTFLVEMGETARILHNCTSRSLVILDEIGRGTSTLDGLSIARAVSEYLLEDSGKRPKTLFATHFHELTSLSDKYPRVRNMRVDVKEWGNSILFLYNILEGRSDRSYGIHVAKMAGLPDSVIERAWQIFKQLEVNHVTDNDIKDNASPQISFFDVPDPLLEELRAIDPETMTPLEALQVLTRLHKSANSK